MFLRRTRRTLLRGSSRGIKGMSVQIPEMTGGLWIIRVYHDIIVLALLHKKGRDTRQYRVPRTIYIIMNHASGCLRFDYLAASEAPRADFHTFHRTIDFRADCHEIRPELTAWQVVSMADIMAEHTFFSADFTLTRHYITSIEFRRWD